MIISMRSHNGWILPLRHIIVNTLEPRQNSHQFPDGLFKWMEMYEFRLGYHMKFVFKGPINNIPA